MNSARFLRSSEVADCHEDDVADLTPPALTKRNPRFSHHNNNNININNNNNHNSNSTTFPKITTMTLSPEPHSSEEPPLRSISSEILSFCETTSIRGVLRIVRARNKRLQMLWTVFEVCLVVGCLTCMILLTMQFLEYNVIHPPRVIRDKPSPFPSITLCNLRPLSKTGLSILERNGLRTPRAYAGALNDYGKRHLYYNNRTEDYHKLTQAMSTAVFLESIANESIRYGLSNPRDSFILKCQVTYLNGSMNIAKSCKDAGTWKQFLHAQYLNCHTFTLEAKLRDIGRTYEIILYLDEDLESLVCPDCFHGHIKTQMSGAVVTIHEPDTFPEINERSINLIPGTLTELRIQTQRNKQKEPPYGRCSPNAPERIHMYDSEYAYTEGACRDQTIQRAIINKCQCRAIEFGHDRLHNSTRKEWPFCGQMPSFVQKTECTDPVGEQCHREVSRALAAMHCKTAVAKEYQKDILDECSMPCLFHSYESDRSTSQWPTKSWQLNYLYSKESAGLEQKEELRPYNRAMELFQAGNHSEALQIMNNLQILERNLLAVLVNRPNANLHIVEEKEVLSLTSFLSQAGGLFSIWIGLTMIFIGELMELLIHCYEVFQARRRRHRSCFLNTVTMASLPENMPKEQQHAPFAPLHTENTFRDHYKLIATCSEDSSAQGTSHAASSHEGFS